MSVLETPWTRRQVAPTSAPSQPGERRETIIDALVANARRTPDTLAMRHRPDSRTWEDITWSQYLTAVREVAGGLAEIGVEPGSRVAVLSENSPAWHIADLGTQANGCVTVPIYPTSSPAQIEYVFHHAKVVACFVDGHAQMGRIIELREKLPELRLVVLADGVRRIGDAGIVEMAELRAMGADRLSRHPDSVDRRMAEVSPEGLATVVYTSGTTGPPKGAMISHHNIMWTLHQVARAYGLGPGERLLSFLPLSHIAERMTSEFMPIAVAGETWFARSLASVADDLPECRPTIFLSVPRVWEKLREGIMRHLAGQPVLVRTAAEHYMALGLRMVDAQQQHAEPPPLVAAAYRALDRSLGRVVRQKVGLDRARLLVTAAAPAHPDLIRWFCAIGLPLLQIYGQTEGCGPTSANPVDDLRIGTVGRALPGMQIRIADDGEILLKGDNVCMGYLDDPVSTAELIDEQGWMHTGDTGVIDEAGNLHIEGRKKDLIITAAGKNIAPQGIETDLANSPLVAEAVVVGEGERYLAALLALDMEELTRWAEEHNKLPDPDALREDPDLLAELQSVVDDVNARRSRAESIRKFRVLPHTLSGASGELTPTMKVRRAVVSKRYGALIADIYAN